MIIETISNQPFYYLRRVGGFGEGNYHLMSQVKQVLITNKLMNKELVIYGIPQVRAIPEEAIYDVGFITTEKIEINELEQGTLLDGDYVIIEIEHTVEAVAKLWQKLTTVIFYQENNLNYDESRFIMERYKKELVDNGRCEFCIPVK